MAQHEDIAADSLQTRTFRMFAVLHSLRTDWGGALILSLGLGPQGAALALASNIAGAVCLTLEDETALAHEALRSGACDFVVNTLDEALRAIKNEVRRQRPLSVGLQGSSAAFLQEMLERGVLPDLFTCPGQAAASRAFQTQGAAVVDVAAIDVAPPNPEWNVCSFTFDTQAERREFDERALALLSTEDALRVKWLHAAPRVLPREGLLRRVIWLTAGEREQLGPFVGEKA